MIKKYKKPELLAPAGDWCNLLTAVENGADSVYFGIRGLNMRNLAGNFDLLELKKVMEFLHSRARKGYLALNVIVFEHELGKVARIMEKARAAGVDAVILWDMAVLSLARDAGLEVHLSTQASVANFQALRFYASLGVKRVILARECRLADIKKIISSCQKENIDCAVESFIHGAMCLSVSGRCFLSEYSFARSANRGECLQPCRREFIIKDTQDESEYVIGKDYLLSPKDLCSVEFIDRLIRAGIHSFKIEGRMRSPEYVRTVTSVYRRAIDAFFAGRFDQALGKELKQELSMVYNRGFSSGFYFESPDKDISRGLETGYEKEFLGEVTRFYKKISVAEVLVRNRSLAEGDTVICFGPRTPAQVAKVSRIEIDHCRVEKVAKGKKAGIELPFPVRAGDRIFLWKEKNRD